MDTCREQGIQARENLLWDRQDEVWKHEHARWDKERLRWDEREAALQLQISDLQQQILNLARASQGPADFVKAGNPLRNHAFDSSTQASNLPQAAESISGNGANSLDSPTAPLTPSASMSNTSPSLSSENDDLSPQASNSSVGNDSNGSINEPAPQIARPPTGSVLNEASQYLPPDDKGFQPPSRDDFTPLQVGHLAPFSFCPNNNHAKAPLSLSCLL